MEGDKTADNDKELTSTSTSSSAMGKLLSTNKEEKSDSNDTLPTSSTDASTSTKSTRSVSDDPISSTSSEMDISKPKPSDNLPTDVVDKASTNFDTEAELLGMSTQPCEKIEENVDDLVNDLETLLGESTDSFMLPNRSTNSKKENTNVTSAIREEVVQIPEYKSEYEVSSNTVTTEKIDISTEIEEKREDENDKNIKDTQESSCAADVKEANIANVNSTNLSDSSSDIGGIHKFEIQEGKEEKPSNQDSIKKSDSACSVKQLEEIEQVSEQGEEVIEPEPTQVTESEIKDAKNDNDDSFDVPEGTTNKQRESTPETVVMSDKTDVPEDISKQEAESNQPQSLCEDTMVQDQEVSIESNECLKEKIVTDGNVDQAADAIISSLKNIETTESKASLIDDANNVEKEKTESTLGDSINKESEKTDNILETVENYEENKNANIEDTSKDIESNLKEENKTHNEEKDEEICSEGNITEKNITLEVIESDAVVSVEIELTEKNNSDIFIAEEHCIQEDAETSINDLEQLSSDKDKVELEDENVSMEALEIQEEEEHLINEFEQENTNSVDHPSESLNADTHNTQRDIETLESAVNVKETIIGNLEVPVIEPVVVSNEAAADKENLQTFEKHKPENQNIEDANVVENADIKKTFKDHSEEEKHIEDSDSTAETVNENSMEAKSIKDGHLQNINLLEEKQDQLEVEQNITEDAAEYTSTSLDVSKTLQTEQEKETSPEGILEEIEITELPDNVDDKLPGNVELLSIDPVVEEPEEAVKHEEAEPRQNDNVKEVNEGEIVEHHLEEMKDVTTSVASDQVQSEAKEDIESTIRVEANSDHELKDRLKEGTTLSPDIENDSENEIKKLDDIIESSKEEVITNKEAANQADLPANVMIKTENAVIETIEKIIETVSNTDSAEISEADMPTESLPDNKTRSLSKDIEMQDNQKVAEVCKVEESTDKVVDTNVIIESKLVDGDKEIENVDFVDNNIVVAEKSTLQDFKCVLRVVDATSGDSKENKDEFVAASETSILSQEISSSVDVKPVSEINIRRKTVEQDLEKVVCLSEESSDSDTNDPLVSLPKLSEDVSSFDDESNLIKIAEEVDQFPDSALPSEDTMPVIEDILSVEPQVISSVASVDSSSNLETILAVASLQNESVSDVGEERRLSEKEIREMEAIRMAVASITDNSSNTYEYLVDNSDAIDNSIQEISNVEEFSSEIPQVSSESETPPERIVENDVILDNSSEGGQQEVVEKNEILPENDNKTEICVLELVSDKESPNSSQNKIDIADASDLGNSVGDKCEKIEHGKENVQSTEGSESSEAINNAEGQNNDKNIAIEIARETVEKSSVRSEASESHAAVEAQKSETETREVIEAQTTENIKKDEALVEDQKPEASNELSTKGLSENAVIIPNKTLEETTIPLPEEPAEKITLVELEAIVKNPKEGISKENEIDISKENRTNNEILSPELAETNKADIQKGPTEEENVPEDTEGSKDVVAPVSQIVEERPLRSRTRRGNKVNEPLTINVEEVDKKEKIYSPKIIIKPVKVPDEEVSTTSDAEGNKGSLKMTITKQSDKMHSILKVYNPEDDVETLQSQEEPIPKLIIKPKIQQVEQQHSPKMTTRSSKAYSPTSTRCSSPRVTIKPVTKPTDTKCETLLSPLKITFKPVVKLEEAIKKQSPKTSKEQEQKNHNPKITIKPIPKPPEAEKEEMTTCMPKVTIKPIKRHLEESEAENEQERSSPKITIKPVVKPAEQDADQLSNQIAPKLKIKPIKKHDDEEISGLDKEQGSPKLSIKPVVKLPELEEEEEIKQRIVLKINKGNLPTPTKDPKKREYPDDDKSEKIGIKLKFSTTGGHTHIIQEKEESNKRQRKDSGYSGGLAKKDLEEPSHKRLLEEKLSEKNKRLRGIPDKLNENVSEDLKHIINAKVESPISLSEDSRSQHSGDCLVPEDSHAVCTDISKIVDIASRTTHIEATPVLTVGIATPTLTPTPKRRGRPRKVPLEIREEFRDPLTTPNISPQVTPQTTPAVEAVPTPESNVGTTEATPSPGGRPKRSCRGQNVMATLGIKPRKPRGRGRGSKVNMGDREPPAPQAPAEPAQTVPMKPEKETKISKAKLKLMQKSAEEEIQKQKELEAANKALQGSVDKKEEATTRRLKVQQHKETEELVSAGGPRPNENPKKVSVTTPEASTSAGVQKRSPISNPEIGPSTSTATIVRTISGENLFAKEPFDDSEDIKNADLKDRPEAGFKGKNSSPKRAAEKFEEATVEEKKPRINVKDDNLNFESSRQEQTSEKSDVSAEEEVDSEEDSELERRRERVLLKKQEAIKKCRAKRMEKLARAAELKRKRQEQAAQQREARKAAEEAERAASDKVRATKRYGRYGVPKPQISLIDAPVEETAGTIKSHRGLFNPETEQINIAQPVPVDDDINFDKERTGPLKHIEGRQPMAVDSADDAQTKTRRSLDTEDVVMLDEETRMSADFRGSRAQTPAKQAVPPPDMVEDSQGSIGTEGGKSRSSKTPKMEVFQDLESTIFTADQLTEYSWNGQGPFMLQEQVAQYLGIKSFKRKYPQITRRPVDMQERDYLKENGLATEAQCDLGLTAVIAQDILDIMYADFQDKYEDYCRCQREKQARELASKQKALNQFTLKPGFDKLDILEQAVQSAAAWNQQFNKERREQRKAHMDLQSLIVHYPKSKMKVIPASKIGHYPVALVPGQFTDHYQEFTPTELNNLPLNTMCYDEIKIASAETDSEDSSSGSDSESESSSGSSGSDASCDDEDCKECIKVEKSDVNGVRETDSDDVVIIENDASSSDSVVLVSVTSAPVTA